MENWLAKDARERIWCQPAADARVLIKTTRLTSPSGEIYGMRVSEHNLRLPTDDDWYHVFQIGGLGVESLGLTLNWAGWMKATDFINTMNIQALFYVESGRTIPLDLVWLRILSNGNFILAVKKYETQQSLDTEALYVRFYCGHFKTNSGYNDTYKSFAVSTVVKSIEERYALVEAYTASLSKPGHTFAFINGHPVETLTQNNIKLWDYVDYIHDGMVREIVSFNIAKLPTFTSALDKVKKYLLHPPKGRGAIDYINDLEIEIFSGGKGVYYHSHFGKSIRQVTYRDYSIPTNRVNDYLGQHGWSTTNTKLYLYIRHSGFEKPLIYENSRLMELYKMSDSQIVGAMVGSNAMLKDWQASTLEQSAYNKIMAARHSAITRDLCTQAYGYNAVARYVANTPQKVVTDNGVRHVTLPPLLACRCTVYEYDADGLLLGYYLHTVNPNDQYVVKNDSCVYVEAIEGTGKTSLDIDFDAMVYQLQEGYNYRFYLEKLVSGQRSGEFEDVTGTDAYSVDENNVVAWHIDTDRRAPVIWCDKDFLSYTFEEDAYDGYMQFSLQTTRNDTGKRIPVPDIMVAKTVEVWLNGHALIPGLDFFVQWPRVVVCNKEYLTAAADYHKPTVVIRARNQGTEVEMPEYGWVVNGLLSNNTRWDVRDDKPYRIILGGRLRSREDVSFREDTTAIVVNSALNGKPYCIDDPLIPLRLTVTGSTYALRDDALAKDKRVEDFMTAYFKQPVLSVHNPIGSRHRVFSPIMNKIIHDLIHNILIPTESADTNFLSTEALDALIEPYQYLLEFDPMLNGADLNYVDVHPHDGEDIIELTELQYSIVQRVNDRYFMNRVVLNKFLMIKVGS